MRKWLALGVQVPFLAMMWVACNGDNTQNADAGDAASVQDVKAEKKPIDTGVQDTGSGACSPATSIDSSQIKFVPPNAPNPTACSDAQIQQLYDACFGPNAAQTPCTAFINAASNKTCNTCMFSTWGTSTALGTLIDVAGVDYADTSGCIAIETGDSSSTGCAAKEQAVLACEVLACGTNCPQVSDQTTFNEWTACTSQADQGVCKTYADAVCDLSDAGTVYTVCQNHQSFDEYYFALAPVFCGGYPADAGVSDAGSDAASDASTSDASSSDAATDAPDGD
jgi:hypothetical protein